MEGYAILMLDTEVICNFANNANGGIRNVKTIGRNL